MHVRLSRAQSRGPRTILMIAAILAVVVFSVVQDRVTAGGARQYVELQRAAAEGQRTPVTIDEIMRPAVRRSVAQASVWSAVVMVTGAITAGMVGRRGGRA
jgi:hypothetical protein